jgi:hypothetical protein
MLWGIAIFLPWLGQPLISPSLPLLICQCYIKPGAAGPSTPLTAQAPVSAVCLLRITVSTHSSCIAPLKKCRMGQPILVKRGRRFLHILQNSPSCDAVKGASCDAVKSVICPRHRAASHVCVYLCTSTTKSLSLLCACARVRKPPCTQILSNRKECYSNLCYTFFIFIFRYATSFWSQLKAAHDSHS